MLTPKKVKYRKWHTTRRNAKKQETMVETRGTKVDFGTHGLKAITYGRITSNEIESARKVISRYVSKTGKMWTRIFPDRPFTQKPAEVKMGKGKGDVQGYVAEIKPGRVMFEVDGVEPAIAISALIKAGKKMSVKTKIVNRI